MSFFHDCAALGQRAGPDARVKLLASDAMHNTTSWSNSQSSLACKLTMNVVQILAERLRRMDQWVVELKTKAAASQSSADLSKLREQLFDTWQL